MEVRERSARMEDAYFIYIGTATFQSILPYYALGALQSPTQIPRILSGSAALPAR